MEDEEDLVDLETQKAFYGLVRELVISSLLALCFYLLANLIVNYFRRRKDAEELYASDEDAVVYRITTWLCAFAVAVSLGAVILLPASILSNEIRHLFPNTSYVNWLNHSLIMGLWNLIFLGSNLSLFFLLPFAFFFTESEGLPGTKKGVMSRVYEAVIILVLVAVLVLGMLWVVDSLTLHLYLSPTHIVNLQALLHYVPLLYSCMATLGVLVTSVCTPVGFSHLFTVLGQIIVQPELHVDVEQELESLKLEEQVLSRQGRARPLVSMATPESAVLLSNTSTRRVEDIHSERSRLERHQRSSVWERHILFPLCFFLLLALMCFSLLLVGCNLLSLIFSFLDVPSYNHTPQGAQDHINKLGEASTSLLGPLGALLEVVLIIYMILASIVGFYSAPLLRRLTPSSHDTPMIKIIINSIVLVVLSSAMPVMVQALGITKFNILGHFSSLSFLSSFWLILSYNLVFFILTCFILFKKATQTVIREVTFLFRDRVRALRLPSVNGKLCKYHSD